MTLTPLQSPAEVLLMSELLESIVSLDVALMRATEQFRWEPLTAVFVVASAAWVKGPLLLAIAAMGDVLSRRMVPVLLASAGAAFGVASLLNALIKGAVERARPPLVDASIDAIGTLPTSFSFPSGHAMTAFAAAGAVAALSRKMRIPALAVATLVALSRPYLGVHFWLDVVVGAALGAAIGVSLALLTERVMLRRWAPSVAS